MQKKILSAPTIFYPESDGQPMAETDFHRKLMVETLQVLEAYFMEQSNVYVSGNLLVYYVEEDPSKRIAPDVFVVFGVAKKLRDNYLIWEETNTPDFVLEVASPSTISIDLGEKKRLYASVFGVKEYYIYDPLHEIDQSFVGYRLVDGEYQEIEFVNGRLPSNVLGLELGERDGKLRLYDPARTGWLYTVSERIERAEIALQKAVVHRKIAEINMNDTYSLN